MVKTDTERGPRDPATGTKGHSFLGLVPIGGIVWIPLIAVVYVVAVMLVGATAPRIFVLAVFVLFPVLLALFIGGIIILIRLCTKENRQGGRLRTHLAALLAVLVMGYLLTVGPAHPLRLLDLRERAAVALTGGGRELQSWAIGILSKPRDLMSGHGLDQWRVPKELWSRQVQRLSPNCVCICRWFKDGREAVHLGYGGGFLHWYIVVGPPGAAPDPNTPIFQDSDWIRWGDGIYDLQQG